MKSRMSRTSAGVIKLINKLYHDNSALKKILITHSRQVGDLALAIAEARPELNINKQFVADAAMLHDIGIYRCHAPSIHCHGTEPYIRHGVIGAQIIRKAGMDEHYARVCERHTGTGLTKEVIEKQSLPLPSADYIPETIEEQLICFADKYYSKSNIRTRKTTQQVIQSLAKFGEEGIICFNSWIQKFGNPDTIPTP